MKRQNLQSWVIDAAHLNITDVVTFRKSLFHANDVLDRYLDDPSKFFIVAPKGFGKTLLLMAKRLMFEEQKSYEVLPRNSIVDRPTGVPNLSQKDFSSIISSPSGWQSLWTISLSLYVLHEKGKLSERQKEIFSKIKPTIEEAEPLPTSIINSILMSTYDIFKQLQNEYHTSFSDKLRSIRTPIVIFIDNVEEFYDKHVFDENEYDYDAINYKTLWVNAQIGLMLASRDLNLGNPHIKVYAAIRKEVIPFLTKSGSLASQVKGCIVDIEYRPDELKDIIERNILNERKSRLIGGVLAGSTMASFFGVGSDSYSHAKTGDIEDAYSYVVRHTLRRPRDIASIGGKIAEISPIRRTEKEVKDRVNRETQEIVDQYLTEMRPHLQYFDESVIFPLITSNIITRSDVDRISHLYDDAMNIRNSENITEGRHVFCNLYKLGLLGWVQRDVETGILKQQFASVGEVSLGKVGCLPDSPVYLIHPMLDDKIARINRSYYDNLNNYNVVGHDIIYRDVRDYDFVAKGDVVNFSAIMDDQDTYGRFIDNFRKLVEDVDRAVTSKVGDGDSFLMMSRNPISLIGEIERVEEALLKKYRQKLRVAIDAGFIENTAGGEIKGGVLRRAARIEQAVKIPGVFVTERVAVSEPFRAWFTQRFAKCDTMTFPHLDSQDGEFIISKGGQDTSFRVALYARRD